MGLDQQARFWATPRTSDTNGAGEHGDGGLDLRPQVEQNDWWNTPTSRDHKDGDMTNSEVPTNALLGRQASRYSLPAPETTPHGAASSPGGQTSRRRLNANFVDWLMSWPPGWTDYGQAETGFAAWLERSRTAFSEIVLRRDR